MPGVIDGVQIVITMAVWFTDPDFSGRDLEMGAQPYL